MKYIITALLSAALIWLLPTGTPVNNSETKVAHTAKAEQPAKAEEAEVTVAAVEEPQAPQPESQPEPVAIPEPPVPTTRVELMAAAGISPADYGAADYIISKESSWNQHAINPSSGSCGLVQELPCGKSGCTLGDGVCQLRWASQYATQRYGSWSEAHSFWLRNHWW